MAGGIACWHLQTTTTKQQQNNSNMQNDSQTPANRLTKACSLGLQHTSLIFDIRVMVNWYLSTKLAADQYHMTILQAQVCLLLLYSTGFRFDGRLKPVNLLCSRPLPQGLAK